MLHILAQGDYMPVLIGFSIKHEKRVSHYSSPGREPNESLHSSAQEYELLKWLSANGHIDSTLCLLKDEHEISLEPTEGHIATEEMKSKLSQHYKT